MRFKIPKNTEKYYWTKHSIGKMKQYGLSAQRISRVIRNPQRTEKGIAENTLAVMQPTSTKVKNGKRIWSREIWAMYQIKSQKKKINDKQEGKTKNKFSPMLELKNIVNREQLKIISVWVYPGISPKNNPIPEDILRELEEV